MGVWGLFGYEGEGGGAEGVDLPKEINKLKTLASLASLSCRLLVFLSERRAYHRSRSPTSSNERIAIRLVTAPSGSGGLDL